MKNQMTADAFYQAALEAQYLEDIKLKNQTIARLRLELKQAQQRVRELSEDAPDGSTLFPDES